MRGNNHKIRSIEERLWAKVTKTETCWLWTGAKHEFGYGVLGAGVRGTGLRKAHRVAWESVNGPVPDGLYVLHKCDVPACVNPDHLFVGTLKDNHDDMRSKHRGSNPPPQRGSANVNAKLTEELVRAIRMLYANGVMQKDIAVTIGVTRDTVSRAVTGKGWAHVV